MEDSFLFDSFLSRPADRNFIMTSTTLGIIAFYQKCCDFNIKNFVDSFFI